jgi:hypothetical protein
MGQLAARLAGGFLQPIDAEALRAAVREALASIDLGELEPIKNLPGMVRAAVGTLDKLWRAGINLAEEKHPRLQAMRSLEAEVLRRLPPSMKRPKELVDLACGRIGYAKIVLGPVEIHGHSEMSPCWRPLLRELSEVVPVCWIAGSRHVPNWLHETKAEIRVEPPSGAQPILFSCTNPQHEVIEAFRWTRTGASSDARRDVVRRGGNLPRGDAGPSEHRAPGAALRANAPAGVVQTPRQHPRSREDDFAGSRRRRLE